MYVPAGFKLENQSEMITFMQRYSFATIITSKAGVPVATQLPFFIEQRGETLILSSHFSAVNEQAGLIENNTSLVIFSEPHAYISPAHYDKTESVPTWDYIAVHAYGKAEIITEQTAKADSLEKMIRFYEQDYLQQWNGLSNKFKAGMMKGIVAFELPVTELQGQKKLSQNKSEVERKRIIETLENSENSTERDIAGYIREL